MLRGPWLRELLQIIWLGVNESVQIVEDLVVLHFGEVHHHLWKDWVCCTLLECFERNDLRLLDLLDVASAKVEYRQLLIYQLLHFLNEFGISFVKFDFQLFLADHFDSVSFVVEQLI